MSKEKVDIYDADDLMDALTKIGGRMQDLETYIQKIKTGLAPRGKFFLEEIYININLNV